MNIEYLDRFESLFEGTQTITIVELVNASLKSTNNIILADLTS